MCHVATSILEVRRYSRLPNPNQQPLSGSDHNKIAATHLSRYCAYLVACLPELLPDDDVWCKNLYTAVKKEAALVLKLKGKEVECCLRLVELLSEQSKHQVLKDGAELGKRLAQGAEEAAWKALADFWSEMVVCVAAACDNLDEHAKAVARGGELVTQLWALLLHVGSVDDEDTAAATAHDAPDADRKSVV